jgi:hypothetical protein
VPDPKMEFTQSVTQQSDHPPQTTSHGVWLMVAVLACYIGIDWWRRNRLGLSWSEIMSLFTKRPARAPEPPTQRRGSVAPLGRSPNTAMDVQSAGGASRSGLRSSPDPEELRRLIQETVQSALRAELVTFRDGLFRDISGLVESLKNPITDVGNNGKPPMPPPPAPLPASESDLLTFWRRLASTNQVTPSNLVRAASDAGLVLSEAPGLLSTDSISPFGFLITNGAGSTWFVPKSGCKPRELAGIYVAATGTFAAGSLTDVIKLAEWKNGAISTIGEVR